MRGTVLENENLFPLCVRRGAVAGVSFLHVVKVIVKTAMTGDELNSGFVVFSIVFE